MKKLTQVLLAFAIGIAMAFSSYGQETVYVISSVNNPTKIQSYGVSGSTLTLQLTSPIPRYSNGPVGLTMNENDLILYISYESTNILQMVNAQTMLTMTTVLAPNANNIAGLVFDHDNNILYAIDRNTNHLYRWTWDNSTKTLTLIGTTYTALPNFSIGYDLDLDEVNDVLYASSRNGYVNYYSTTNLAVLGGTINFTHACIGVAFDGTNNLLYTTGGFAGSQQLQKYDLTTTNLTSWNLGTNLIGVNVNKANGYVYCTNYNTGDNLVVIDPNTGVVQWSSPDIGDPTDVIYTGVGYNPLNLTKTVVPTCFTLGQNLTYTISYTNVNPTAVTNVIVTDTLPANVTFVSASGTPTVVGNVVTWPAIPSLAAGVGGSYTLVVTVNSGVVVDNVCTINSNETAEVFITEQTNECSGPVVPLSDWAIYIVIVLIGVAIWFRFRK